MAGHGGAWPNAISFPGPAKVERDEKDAERGPRGPVQGAADGAASAAFSRISHVTRFEWRAEGLLPLRATTLAHPRDRTTTLPYLLLS
ncbi:hypothetical protein J6590_056774 [Homalodisca vitripennis]|nr:hypothetical protein J6590_056774 [Homalodisca vitripennis]